MGLKLFDAVALATWTAMGLAFVAGLCVMAMRPAPHAIYTADTGLCDSGCSDLR